MAREHQNGFSVEDTLPLRQRKLIVSSVALGLPGVMDYTARPQR